MNDVKQTPTGEPFLEKVVEQANPHAWEAPERWIFAAVLVFGLANLVLLTATVIIK